MKPPTHKKKFEKLNKYEKALILLADYMENPYHDQYRMVKMVSDILGIELIK